jgi:hypothetical protein
MTKTRQIIELKKQIADLKTAVNLQNSIIEEQKKELEKIKMIPERFSPKSELFLDSWQQAELKKRQREDQEFKELISNCFRT